MGKKEKAAVALEEDFKAIMAVVPKLQDFIKVHKEIAAGYEKYRKNGGEAISGIEKHLGCKEQCCDSVEKTKKLKPETDPATEFPEVKKTKKKKSKAKPVKVKKPVTE